jgi:hypothetical protein
MRPKQKAIKIILDDVLPFWPVLRRFCGISRSQKEIQKAQNYETPKLTKHNPH